MKKIRIGIIGCGTIGSELAKACLGRLKDKVELFAVCDADTAKAAALKKALDEKVKILGLDDIVKEASLVVEAAGAKVSGEILEKCVASGTDCMIMSVGGLLGKEKLLVSAAEKGIGVYIPSGAICGIDALKAAAAGKIESVTITTRKPPKGLAGAPYIEKTGFDITNVKEETVVFEGTALDAVKGFPQNINVAAVLSIAGIGAQNTRVKIVTSPDYKKNVHEVEITGSSGRIFTRSENVPSSANPKTSELAILSAIATLEQIASSVRIGT